MDARTSRYHEVYARSMRDPEGFWGEAAAELDWYEPAKKVFDPSQGIYGRWFAGGVCNTCYNALDRHVAGGRANQTALIYDSPVTRTKAAYQLRRIAGRGEDARRHDRGFRRRQGRPRHPLHADGAGSGDGDARLRAHRRRAFGGVRRLRGEGARDPHRRRQAEADPVGELRHRARPHRRIQAAARRSDQACKLQAAGLHDPAAPAGASRDDRRPRSRLGVAAHARRWRTRKRRIACRCSRPIRSTFSTRRARPAFRKAWCATMAATWSR